MDFLGKYFQHTVEYPTDVANDILPLGMMWHYISRSFLEGFINYVEIQAAFLHSRYHSWDDNLRDHQINIMDPPGSFNWVKFSGTKAQIFEKLSEKGRVFHSKLDWDFQDDVLILAKARDLWYFFWFDRDGSDCSIGRFRAAGVESQVVIQDFREWCLQGLESEQAGDRPREIPLHYFQGWLG